MVESVWSCDTEILSGIVMGVEQKVLVVLVVSVNHNHQLIFNEQV